MICILGESGAGKSVVAKMIKDKYGLQNIVTYTTRPKRKGEVDGLDYHFISEKKFNDMKKEEVFAETASYRGWSYGTAIDDCTDNKVIVITPRGFRNLCKISGLNILSVYIKVPRRDRLIMLLKRGDDIEEAYRRSMSDVGQFDGIEDEVDFVVENPEYKLTVSDIAMMIMIRRGR